MFGITNSQDLYTENVDLFLNETKLRELFLLKKKLQEELKTIDEAIGVKKDELIEMMKSTNVKQVALDEEFDVVYVAETSSKRLIPKAKIIDYLLQLGVERSKAEEDLIAERKVKAHIRVVPKLEE